MDKEIAIIGGIKGFQAYSTNIVTTSICETLLKNGIKFRELTLEKLPVPSILALKWTLEVILRYFVYPCWCQTKISSNEIVYITDHANAGVLNWLSDDIISIVHCHDLTSLRPLSSFPYQIRLRNRLIHLLSTKFKKKGLISADHIIAISEFTKQELCRWLGIDESKITVVYNGISHDDYYPEDKKKARMFLNLPDEHIIMTVGPASYRKNLMLVAQLLTKGRLSQKWIWLHVGQLEDRAVNLLKRNNLQDRLIELQNLTNKQMRYAYNAADVFLFPSLYEGFGLPPVEAMACGTPVIAAPCAAIPEILGDACLYASPNNPEEWSETLMDILSNNLTRSRLIEKGFLQASRFKWSLTVEKILNTISTIST